jgi:CheY-like chemotaxis protein
VQAEAQLAQAQKLEVLGRLSGGIAHDFNNMLAVIMSGISIVKDRIDKSDREADRAIEQALEGVRRSAELVRSLQTISRKHPLFPESTDVNRLLDRMSAVLARTLGEGIEVRYLGGCGLWPAFVDPHQLETAILNLALNARDAMPNGGILTIEVGNSSSPVAGIGGTSGDRVLISVSDTGIGMSPEMTARAIEPFFTTKEPGKGTGLGLSQVHGFVQQSGGHMEIESTKGRGTTIKLYLPRAKSRPATIRPAADVEHGSLPRARKGETVLVVEDREEVRQANVAAFEQLGYEVVEAPSGVEALEMLKQAPFIALLFSDVMMPGMDGYELARQAQASHPRLKVILTTGLDGVSAAQPRTNGWPILPKPFTLDELAWKVRGLLDEAETSGVGT